MNTSILFRRYNTDSEIQIDIVELNATIYHNLQHTTRCGIIFDLTQPDRLSPYINSLQQENLGGRKVIGGWFSVESTNTAGELVGRLSELFREPASNNILNQIISAEQAAHGNTTLVKSWSIQQATVVTDKAIKTTQAFVEVPMRIMGRFPGGYKM